MLLMSMFQFKLFFFKGKAQVNAKNAQGLTPLHLAAHEGYDKMAKILVENGKNEINLLSVFIVYM